MSQSPQTGQVYFNYEYYGDTHSDCDLSQSPQTGQVYFNSSGNAYRVSYYREESQSPQTGQVYFNLVNL